MNESVAQKVGSIFFPDFNLKIEASNIAISGDSMKSLLGFGKDIYWYGIIIAFGFALAVFYAMKRAKTFGLKEDNILDMLFFAVPIAIIGARLYYCLSKWDVYSPNPISILYIWEGGLAIYGGVIGAVLGVFIFSKVKKVPMRPVVDIGALGLLIGQSIGRWGNFMNREAYGDIYDGFLRMGIETSFGSGVYKYYHPTFLYESLWNVVGFIALHIYSKRRKFDGEVFALYVAWYGLGRAWVEGLRLDSLRTVGNLRTSQIVAIVSCLVAVAFLVYTYVKRKPNAEGLYVNTLARMQTEQAEESENKA